MFCSEIMRFPWHAVCIVVLYVAGNLVVQQLDYSLLHPPREQRRSFKQNDKLSLGFTQLVSWGETRERDKISNMNT